MRHQDTLQAGRRHFLRFIAGSLLGAVAEATHAPACARGESLQSMHRYNRGVPSPSDATITIFLCGDVMTGRGIDQVLPHPGDPTLHESWVTDAAEYVRIAERANGPIPGPVAFGYPWGEALEELARTKPDVRLINLETAVTDRDDWWPGKGIHYRMHPRNVECLSAAGVDCCALANNHVLDWGYPGLEQTLETLAAAGMRTCGAGRTLAEAQAPAVLECPGKGRVIVLALGHGSSGIPGEWGARPDRPGVDLLPDLTPTTVGRIAERVRAVRRAGDIVVASIHWGGNWGYHIPAGQRRFARQLIDAAGVDAVHGHSSHHPRGIEVYREKPILYGCGDFLNDYEGISGQEAFRGDLTLMYFLTLDPASGRLLRLSLVPLQIRRFRLHRPSAADAAWLREVMARECGRLGTTVAGDDARRFELRWIKWD